MQSLTRLRQCELAVCLGLALSVGRPGAAMTHTDVARRATAPAHLAATSSPMRLAGIGSGALASPTVTTSVTNCNDSGSGSLRAAVAAATNGELIDLGTLACSTITLTSGAIVVEVSGLTLSGPADRTVTLDGGGTDRVLDHDVQFDTLTVQHLTLTHGLATDKGGCIYSNASVVLRNTIVTACAVEAGASPALGGAIYTHGNLELRDSVVSASHANNSIGQGSGGGALVYGTLTAHASSISGNSAGSLTGSYGGGVWTQRAYIDSSTIDNNYAHSAGGIHAYGFAGSVFHVSNSTIANNSAYFVGGVDTWGNGDFELSNSTIAFNCAAATQGILVGPQFAYGIGLHSLMPTSSTINLRSSIVANNTICSAPRAGRMVQSTVYDATSAFGVFVGSNNLIGSSNVALPPDTLQVDPQLGALADNGGATRTLALLSGSPAIDTGSNAGYGFPYDQRGRDFARVVGANADIGAYETQGTGVTHSVDNCADTGSGSLRDTLALSLSGDAIDLSHLACTTITLTSGALQIPFGNLDLIGPGAAALTIDGSLQDRVIEHSGSGILRISGLALQDGRRYEQSGAAKGGCIISAASLDLSDVIVTRCQAVGENGYGGAIHANRLSITRSTVSASGVNGDRTNTGKGGGLFVASKLSMDASTIDGNTAPANPPIANGAGGGIYAVYGAQVSITASTLSANQATVGSAAYLSTPGVRLIDSTVSGNSGVAAGAFTMVAGSIIGSTITDNTCAFQTYQTSCGLFLGDARSELQSSLVFGNTTNGVAYDIGGTGRLVGANNLVGSSSLLVPPDTLHDDPLLGPLQDNGGPTATHALLPGSPAIDHGNNVLNLDDDQRGSGFMRSVGAAVDIGAFEVQASNDLIFSDGFEAD